MNFRQKKRRINPELLRLLASGVTQRRVALILKVNKKTIARKLPILAERCRATHEKEMRILKGRVLNVQLDDLITKENSKLKPLSVSIAVDEDRRKILAIEVSRIPAFGHLARIAVKKYGYRPDEHFAGLDRLFKKLKITLNEEVRFRSDEHVRYPGFVKVHFPRAKHETFRSERGCVAGQGELKKVAFDPLFVINHTCAMLRANVNRLIRKTWSTTKDPECLKDHLDLFVYFYNQNILRSGKTPFKGGS